MILLYALLLSACSDTSQSTAKRSQKPPHRVETVQAAYLKVAASRTLPGTLQAIRELHIINQAEGLLTELKVYPGDPVSKGQILARLDDALPEAELKKAQATLKQAKLDLRRLLDLAQRKMASDSEVAEAQTRVDIASAELELKQKQFQHTRIRAPMDGIISERLLEPGDVIPLYTHLLTLVDTSSLKVEVYLSELLFPLIKKGNTVDIRIDALGDSIFSGRITRIYPTIDKNTRRGTIEVILNPVPEGARPGQLCRVTVYTSEKSRLMIPYNSLRYDKQGAYVFLIRDNQAQRQNVATGIQHNNMIEILSGLTAGDEIVSQGFFGLKNQMPIQKVSPETRKVDIEN